MPDTRVERIDGRRHPAFSGVGARGRHRNCTRGLAVRKIRAIFETMIRNLLLLVCLCAWLPPRRIPTRWNRSKTCSRPTARASRRIPTGSSRRRPWRASTRSATACARRGAAQVAVVAVDAIAGGDPFTFAYELFSKWGVGRREDSNGVGILLVREQREIRFVTGAASRAVLPDALCKRIRRLHVARLPRRRLRPRHGARRRSRGGRARGQRTRNGVPDAVPQEDDTPWWVIALIVGGCVAVPLVAVVRMLRCPRCKRWFALRSQGERIVLRAEGWRMVEQTLVCRRCGETIRRRRREADGQRHRRPRRRNVDRRPGSLRRRFRRRTCGRRLRGGGFGGGGAGSKW